MSDFLRFRGLDELGRFLDQVPAKLERNVMRGALRAGMNLVKPVAQSNIHSVSGDLARSLKVRTDARNGRVTASLYTRLFEAQFVEFGTKPHGIEPKNRRALVIGGLFFASVRHPGARPHPFLRPALDTQAQAAVLAVAAYIKARLAAQAGLDTADVDVGAA